MVQLIVMGALLVLVAGCLKAVTRGTRSRPSQRHPTPKTARAINFSEPKFTPVVQLGDAVDRAFSALVKNDVSAKSDIAYRDKFRLLNNTELALYRRLTEAVPAMLVFSQVSMSQLFHIKGRKPVHAARANRP